MKQFLFSFLVLLMSTSLTLAQRTVSGKVTDAAGDAVIGASVFVKEAPGVGTITDVDGMYQLNVPSNGNTLVFSYTGFETFESAITGGSVNVTMQEGKLLDEVVVTGYGSQIKSRLTGNIAKVSGKDLADAPVVSLDQALQGRAAGVFIEQNNGKVGGASRMRIRGSSSINASSQPLFVIDGIPISTENMNGLGSNTNPLAALNPNDIESVEVLKDASAAAIYGSRGANGVVIVTTKKGSKGASNIDFNVQYGSSNPTNLREFMNGDEFISFFREAAANSDAYENDDFWVGFNEGRLARYAGHAGERVDGVFQWTEAPQNTDWQREAFKRANSMMANISARGGTDKLQYYTSAAYNNQDGIIVGNDFKRYTGRLNLNSQINDWIDLGVNMNLSRTLIDQVTGDNAFNTPIQLVALSPITPVRDKNSRLYDTPTTTYYNGLIDVEDSKREITETRTLANVNLGFKLAEGLKWNNELGFDLTNLKENGFFGARTLGGRATNGNGFGAYAENQNIIGKSFLSYDKSFSNLNLNAVLGTEAQKTVIDGASVEGVEFPGDEFKTIASAAEIQSGSSTITEYSFISYFSRFNFDINRKILFTLSGRLDGSSRFGTNNRYGFFPAASVGYVLSEESFLQNSDVMSFLKLRASYGRTGNAAIENFGHLGLYGAATYNNLPGIRPTQIANPDLQWEKTDQLDIGVDFGLFNNRVTGEIDFYNKNTSDLLLLVPVPATTGFNTQFRNIGAVRNRGVELVLNTNNMSGQFKWTTSFNIALNRNTVTNLGEQTLIDEGSSRFMNVVQVDQPLGVFYGAEYAGVDPANGDALWYLNTEENPREVTNDFNSAQFVQLGNPNPDWIGGLTNNFSYKNIDLSFTFQGVFGNMIHLAGDGFMACNGCWYDNQTRDQLNAWKNPGDITNVPQARLGLSNGDQARSSRYLSDGSYLRLRNLSLGYNFPKSFLKKYRMSNLKVYMQGQNLLTFTKFIGWDPEVSADFATTNVRSGIDFYSAPQARTITFGLSTSF